MLLDYDSKKNKKDLDFYTRCSGEEVWWKCHICGDEKLRSIKSRAFNRRGCIFCRAKKTQADRILEKISKEGSLLDNHPEIAIEWDFSKNKLRPENYLSTSDTEVILHLISTAKGTLIDRIVYALQSIAGAFSLVLLTNDSLIGVRDPFGIRPLVLGKLNDTYILSSESCGLDIIGADLIRDVEPGEILIIKNNTINSIKPFKKTYLRPCLFEYIYFSRPDSILEGRNVYDVRKSIGHQLAVENPNDNKIIDVVIPIPDSGNASALGYSEKIKKPFEFGIIRNHYTGRTFIEDSISVRNLSVKLKHNPNIFSFKDKSIALVDDSIVRGTTSVKIVEMLRNCGVKNVHMRIASPPVKHPCFYGIDTPTKEELLASKFTIDQIKKYIGADSLKFVTLDGVYKALGFQNGREKEKPMFTDHYFSGDYPVKLIDQDAGIYPAQLSLLIEPTK